MVADGDLHDPPAHPEELAHELVVELKALRLDGDGGHDLPAEGLVGPLVIRGAAAVEGGQEDDGEVADVVGEEGERRFPKKLGLS